MGEVKRLNAGVEPVGGESIVGGDQASRGAAWGVQVLLPVKPDFHNDMADFHNDMARFRAGLDGKQTKLSCQCKRLLMREWHPS